MVEITAVRKVDGVWRAFGVCAHGVFDAAGMTAGLAESALCAQIRELFDRIERSANQHILEAIFQCRQNP